MTKFYQNLNIGSWYNLEQSPIVTVIFVQATFVHIRNISAVNDSILTKLEQMQTSMVSFVQAIYVLTTYVNISNILAVTDSILA